MRILHHLFLGLAILLWGTAVAVGQDRFGFAQCDPCEPVVDPCDPCGGFSHRHFSNPFTFGGWIDMGVYTNAHGYNNNGPMLTSSKRRTDVVMNQLYFFTEKELDTRRGWDWGARADFVYGAHAGSMQTYDGTFDYEWGQNKHGYSMSAYKLYGELGYQNLSVRAGKFVTPIGWEASASKDNFFYSHSYCYMIEPATHMGVLATYELSDRFSFSAGWVTGEDASFKNPDNGRGILTGFDYSLSDNATVYYWIGAGKQRRDWGYFGIDGSVMTDYFIQSICLEWEVTDRFTYVLQYNLRNDSVKGEGNASAYGINNHFLYKLNEQWRAGMRFEWLRENNFGYILDDTGNDFYQLTWGLNWTPYKNVSIRPEIRYDWVKGGGKLFGPSDTFGGYPVSGLRSTQLSGGCGVVVSF